MLAARIENAPPGASTPRRALAFDRHNGDDRMHDTQEDASAAMRGANLCGQRFGRLVVTTRLPGGCWECRCDCGGNAPHGQQPTIQATPPVAVLHSSRAARASSWAGSSRPKNHLHLLVRMMQRCYDLQDRRFHDYGGRGIGLCDRWRFGKMAPRRSVLCGRHGRSTRRPFDRTHRQHRGYDPGIADGQHHRAAEEHAIDCLVDIAANGSC